MKAERPQGASRCPAADGRRVSSGLAAQAARVASRLAAVAPATRSTRARRPYLEEAVEHGLRGRRGGRSTRLWPSISLDHVGRNEPAHGVRRSPRGPRGRPARRASSRTSDTRPCRPRLPRLSATRKPACPRDSEGGAHGANAIPRLRENSPVAVRIVLRAQSGLRRHRPPRDDQGDQVEARQAREVTGHARAAGAGRASRARSGR